MYMAKALEGSSGCGDGGGTCDTANLSMTTVGVVSASGAALLVVGLVALAVKDSVPAPPEEERHERERIAPDGAERERIEPDRAERERIHRRNRDQAFGLLKTATQAARSGDCTTAIKLGDQIRSIDVDVWHAWFLREPAIERCRDAATAPTPVAPRAAPDAQPAPPITPREDAP
jgi:hypothetical protein